jgi:hypothetical protein
MATTTLTTCRTIDELPVSSCDGLLIGDPVDDNVPAGADGGTQRGGRCGVTFERAQPAPVGADHIGQHVGIEPVVLVAGRAVPTAGS